MCCALPSTELGIFSPSRTERRFLVAPNVRTRRCCSPPLLSPPTSTLSIPTPPCSSAMAGKPRLMWGGGTSIVFRRTMGIDYPTTPANLKRPHSEHPEHPPLCLLCATGADLLEAASRKRAGFVQRYGGSSKAQPCEQRAARVVANAHDS